jgi:hypothetical protein
MSNVKAETPVLDAFESTVAASLAAAALENTYVEYLKRRNAYGRAEQGLRVCGWP